MRENLSDYEKYLKAFHLGGKAMTLTIVKITEEVTHPNSGKAEMGLVLWFKERPFGLILSTINRRTLIELCGDSISNMIGKQIIVKAVTVEVAGVEKEPIRILKQRPAATKKEAT